MTSEHDRGDSPFPGGMSRRQFIKLAAMTGLLAGCRPIRQLVATPTSTPITGMRPDARNKVVRARHNGVWDGDTLMPEAIWLRMAESGRSMPIMVTICSMRVRASRAVLAWTVVIDPSWPVFMA